jgi:hypothetical protein
MDSFVGAILFALSTLSLNGLRHMKRAKMQNGKKIIATSEIDRYSLLSSIKI